MSPFTTPLTRTLATPLLCLGLANISLAAQAVDTATGAPSPRPLKVLIISMFGPEAEPWLAPFKLDQQIPVLGLSADYPALRCNTDDVCLLTTGMGHANAAASTLAVVLNPQFDLHKTYFLIAGIAGINPEQGTLGTAAWARYLVDFGIQHEFDVREKPKDWPTGYFGIGTKGPGEKPVPDYRTEVFQLNEALLQKALALSQNVALEDSDQARAYRKRYPKAPANQPPRVTQCDTLAGDTWWHGKLLGDYASAWTRTLTDGKGTYCTTQQEDNATYAALQRGARVGLLDIQRLAVLRTGSNFDRPHPGQTPYQSLKSNSGGFLPATHNLARVGGALVNDIVKNWGEWEAGVAR